MEATAQDFDNVFLPWEQKTKDTIDFKKVYVDMAGGDVIAGLVLSEIVYWYLPAKDGSKNKLRVVKKGNAWIAAARYEWWDRVRLTPRQTDRALKVLIKEGVIEKGVMRFGGKPTTHVRIIKERFMELWNKFLNDPAVNPFLPNGENNELTKPLKRNDESVKTLTETTAETTTENTVKDIPSTANAIDDTPPDSQSKKGSSFNGNAKQKTAQKTPTPNSAPPPPPDEMPEDSMFYQVCKHVFGIDNKATLGLKPDINGRAGMLTSWLNGSEKKTYGRVKGVTPLPKPATVEQFKMFAADWQAGRVPGISAGTTMPRSMDKFPDHWRAWAQWRNGVNAGTFQDYSVPAPEKIEWTPEDEAEMQAQRERMKQFRSTRREIKDAAS